MGQPQILNFQKGHQRTPGTELKKQPIQWEAILANRITHKGLTSRIRKA